MENTSEYESIIEKTKKVNPAAHKHLRMYELIDQYSKLEEDSKLDIDL